MRWRGRPGTLKGMSYDSYAETSSLSTEDYFGKYLLRNTWYIIHPPVVLSLRVSMISQRSRGLSIPNRGGARTTGCALPNVVEGVIVNRRTREIQPLRRDAPFDRRLYSHRCTTLRIDWNFYEHRNTQRHPHKTISVITVTVYKMTL